MRESIFSPFFCCYSVFSVSSMYVFFSSLNVMCSLFLPLTPTVCLGPIQLSWSWSNPRQLSPTDLDLVRCLDVCESDARARVVAAWPAGGNLDKMCSTTLGGGREKSKERRRHSYFLRYALTIRGINKGKEETPMYWGRRVLLRDKVEVLLPF